MPKAYISQRTSIKLEIELSIAEALMLRAMMQNPRFDDNEVKESPTELAVRTAIFHAIPYDLS